jgi:hypothetical protein
MNMLHRSQPYEIAHARFHVKQSWSFADHVVDRAQHRVEPFDDVHAETLDDRQVLPALSRRDDSSDAWARGASNICVVACRDRRGPFVPKILKLNPESPPPGGHQKSASSLRRGPAPASRRDFFYAQTNFQTAFGAPSSTALRSPACAAAKPKQTHSFWNRSRGALSEVVFAGSEFEYFLSGGHRAGGRSKLCALRSPHRWRRLAHLSANFRKLFVWAAPGRAGAIHRRPSSSAPAPRRGASAQRPLGKLPRNSPRGGPLYRAGGAELT